MFSLGTGSLILNENLGPVLGVMQVFSILALTQPAFKCCKLFYNLLCPRYLSQLIQKMFPPALCHIVWCWNIGSIQTQMEEGHLVIPNTSFCSIRVVNGSSLIQDWYLLSVCDHLRVQSEIVWLQSVLQQNMLYEYIAGTPVNSFYSSFSMKQGKSL